MLYFRDQQEYQAYMYRREVRSTANRTGMLLLIFFGAEATLSIIAGIIMKLNGSIYAYVESSSMQLLLNGLLSSLIFFLVGAIYCLIRKLSFARLFPFEKIGLGMTVMLCVIGLTFSLMSNYAASLVTDVFGLFGLSNHGGDVVGDGSLPSVLLYYLTVAVLPAFAEEFAFRGIVMGSLRKHSDALAVLVSSAAFALMHGNFVQIPFTFCCGLAFGFIAIKTNSLLPSIIIHFLNNAMSVTYDVLTERGIISAESGNLGYCAIIVALCVLSLFFIRWFIKNKPEMFRFDDSDRDIPYRTKLKTTVSSPTMIAFAAVMMLYSAYALISPYLDLKI